MKTNFKGKKASFGLVLLLIGSMIGAGFITGAEIWHFFARFGGGVFVGLFTFGVLLYYLIVNELKVCDDECVCLKSGGIWLKKQVNFASELLIASAMISGLRDVVFGLQFNGRIFIFSLAIIVIFIILLFGIKSFSFYNYFVIGFIVYLLIILMKNFDEKSINIDNYFNITNSAKSCIYAVLYVFMNISALKPILRSRRRDLDKEEKKFVAISFSISMIFVVFILSVFLINSKNLVEEVMPLKLYFCTLGKGYEIIFIIGVVVSMISTCVSCSFGVKEKFLSRCGGGVFASICSLILILILGFIPFEIFVSKFYPLIGFSNFLIFIFDILKN